MFMTTIAVLFQQPTERMGSLPSSVLGWTRLQGLVHIMEVWTEHQVAAVPLTLTSGRHC